MKLTNLSRSQAVMYCTQQNSNMLKTVTGKDGLTIGH